MPCPTVGRGSIIQRFPGSSTCALTPSAVTSNLTLTVGSSTANPLKAETLGNLAESALGKISDR